MQAIDKASRVVRQRVQFAAQVEQLTAEQLAQRMHNAEIAGGGHPFLIVQYAYACIHAEYRFQCVLECGDLAGLLDYPDEARVREVVSQRQRDLRTGGERGGAGRRRINSVAKVSQDVHGTAMGHAAIKQQGVESCGRCLPQRILPIHGKGHLVAQRHQCAREKLARRRVIVRDQYGARCAAVKWGRAVWVHTTFRVVHLVLAEWSSMRRVSTRPLAFFLVAWIALSWGAAAHAGLSVGADTLVVPGLTLADMQADLDPQADGKGIQLRLTARKADIPAMGWRKLGLALEGQLDRDELGRWIFAGRVRLRGAPGGALTDAAVNIVADEAANTLTVSITQDKALAEVALPIDQVTHAQITLKNLPAGWLQGLLATVRSGRLTAGKVNADLALDLLDTGTQAAGQFALDGVGFDSPGGKLAGQKISGSGRLGLDTGKEGATIDLDAGLRGGEWLLGPLYANLPAHLVQVSLSVRSQKGVLGIRRLRLTDPDALQLEGELGFDAGGDLSQLRLDRFNARFPAAYERYGKGLLRTWGLDGLRASGDVAGHVAIGAGGPTAFAFQTGGLDLAMADGRLGVNGLHGSLDWSVDEDRPTTRLGWRSLQVYRIPNGAAEGSWRSKGGTLSLEKPMAIPVLDGDLRILSLGWKPAAATGERLQTSLALTQIDMGAFCRAVGWPEFGGTLGGAVPSLRYVDDRVELGGGLSLNVFDGFVDITGMTLSRPFSDAPVLAGNVALRNLDLSKMTSVFDFGSITGRLRGGIDDLRLVAWQPSAFKASLVADQGGRISQKAVNNLTSVGGGGIAGGLQGTVLKLFKTFGYKRIGLSCTLKGDVCTMGGLGTTKDGYTMVEGSGLPHLTVVGHQREVDWPTLLRRLQAATKGDGPTIQ